MPRGSKAKYSNKQKRQAKHIEKSYEKRGASKRVAEKRAWQTVNKQSGGGRKANPVAKKTARKESGQRAANSHKLGSARVQKKPTRHKASSSAR